MFLIDLRLGAPETLHLQVLGSSGGDKRVGFRGVQRAGLSKERGAGAESRCKRGFRGREFCNMFVEGSAPKPIVMKYPNTNIWSVLNLSSQSFGSGPAQQRPPVPNRVPAAPGGPTAAVGKLVFVLTAPGELTPESFKATTTHVARRDALEPQPPLA